MSLGPVLQSLIPRDGALYASFENDPYTPLNAYFLVTNKSTNVMKKYPLTMTEALAEVYLITGLQNGAIHSVQYVQVDDTPSGEQYYSNSLSATPCGVPEAPTLQELIVSTDEQKFFAVVKYNGNNGGNIVEIDFAILNEDTERYVFPPSTKQYTGIAPLNYPTPGSIVTYQLALPGGAPLVTSTTYTVACLARNPAGNSPLSNSITKKLELEFSPNPPVLISATGGISTTTAAIDRLVWNASIPVAGYDVLAYQVFAWPVTQLNPTPLNAIAFGNVPVVTGQVEYSYDWVSSSLTNGVAYQFAVRAVNGWTPRPNSALSNIKTAVPFIPASFAPNAVPTLTNQGTTMTAVIPSAQGTFSTVNSVAVSQYIWKLYDGMTEVTAGSTNEPNTTVTIPNLAIGTTYTFEVYAQQNIPQNLWQYIQPPAQTTQSATISASEEIAVPPSEPLNPTALAWDDDEIQYSWQVPSNDGGSEVTYYYYEVWLSKPSVNLIPNGVTGSSIVTPPSTLPSYPSSQPALKTQAYTTVLNALVGGLSLNTAYYFRVMAYNTSGFSKFSTIIGPNYTGDGLPEVTNPTAVALPQTTSAIPIKVTWNSLVVPQTAAYTISSFSLYRVEKNGSYTFQSSVPYSATKPNQLYEDIINVGFTPNSYKFAIQTIGTFNNLPDVSGYVFTPVVNTALAPTVDLQSVSNGPSGNGVVTFRINNNKSPIIAQGIMLFAPAAPSYVGVEPNPVNINITPIQDDEGFNTYVVNLPYPLLPMSEQPILISAANSVGVGYEQKNLM